MVKIFKAKKSDFPEIFLLFKELWPHKKFLKKRTFEVWKKILRKKDSFQLVLREEKSIIGYSAVDFRQDIEENGRIGYLTELIVTKKVQGIGYGRLLLNETIRLARKNGCKEIQFPSTPKRKKAWKLYYSLGFKNTASFFWKEI
ncbi:MAG: GNAT family N-acetyltransferase [Nanoarchaeota archaeon]|nr:GNAT family N-acetyltransferase [Nanoarchaeota archaeon]